MNTFVLTGFWIVIPGRVCLLKFCKDLVPSAKSGVCLKSGKRLFNGLYDVS
jgi:hypothetical protein